MKSRIMRRYRPGSHAKYDLKVHLVWCPKYRKRVLTAGRDLPTARWPTMQIVALRDQTRTYTNRSSRAVPGIGAELTAQSADRIAALLQGLVVSTPASIRRLNRLVTTQFPA
jgi:hypothetical protein